MKYPLLKFLISFDDDNVFPKERTKLCSTTNIKELKKEIFKLNFSIYKYLDVENAFTYYMCSIHQKELQ